MSRPSPCRRGRQRGPRPPSRHSASAAIRGTGRGREPQGGQRPAGSRRHQGANSANGRRQRVSRDQSFTMHLEQVSRYELPASQHTVPQPHLEASPSAKPQRCSNPGRPGSKQDPGRQEPAPPAREKREKPAAGEPGTRRAAQYSMQVAEHAGGGRPLHSIERGPVGEMDPGDDTWVCASSGDQQRSRGQGHRGRLLLRKAVTEGRSTARQKALAGKQKVKC